MTRSPLIRLIINHWFYHHLNTQHWCARCGTSWIISTLLGKTWAAGGGVIENECVIINPGHMLSVERWKGADQLLRSVSNHDPGSLLQLQHWTTNRPLHTWWLQHYIWHNTTVINHQMSHHHQHTRNIKYLLFFLKTIGRLFYEKVSQSCKPSPSAFVLTA